jgi:hypothetical protein
MSEDPVARDEAPVQRETVVVDTGSRGGGGAIVAILVVLVLGVLAFLFFSGYLGSGANKGDINVNVSMPKVELPDIRIDNPAPAQQQQEQPAANQSGK